MAVTERLEVRVRPESKRTIAYAASLRNVGVSEFVRQAAEDLAVRIVEQHEHETRLPATFFDEMLQSLDAPADPNDALTRAATRRRSKHR